MKIELRNKNINLIFGLILLILGIGLIHHSITDFFKYNFTTALFIIMRMNSSIIAEFIFGILLLFSGILIFLNNKNWLTLIKILAISIIVNLVFSLWLTLSIFNWELLAEISIRVVIGFVIYKLTEYLIRMNLSKWNLKAEKWNSIVGIIIGLFPYLFRNIFF